MGLTMAKMIITLPMTTCETQFTAYENWHKTTVMTPGFRFISPLEIYFYLHLPKIESYMKGAK